MSRHNYQRLSNYRLFQQTAFELMNATDHESGALARAVVEYTGRTVQASQYGATLSECSSDEAS